MADRNFCMRNIMEGWSSAGACQHALATAVAAHLGVPGHPHRRRRMRNLVVNNLPQQISAATLAERYRKRWTIEGMFQRLEAVLNSELRARGHPRAALLGFSIAVLVYNVLAVLKKSAEHANRKEAPSLEALTYYVAMLVNDALLASLFLLPKDSFLRSTSPRVDRLSAVPGRPHRSQARQLRQAQAQAA